MVMAFFRSWPWRGPEVTFTTSLHLDEVQRRMAGAFTYRSGFWGPPSKHGFYGQVKGSEFYLVAVYKRVWQAYSHLFLYGRLIQVPEGTRVEAAFRFDPVLGLALAGEIAVSVALGIFDVTRFHTGADRLALGLAVALLLIYGGYWYYAWHTPSHRSELVSFLRQLLADSAPS